MIEGFVGVVKAHRIQQPVVQRFLNNCRVACFEGVIQSRQFPCLGASLFPEPFQHLPHEDLAHLTIGNAQFKYPTGWPGCERQIACHMPVNHRDLDEAARILDEAGYIDVDGDGFRELPDGGEMSIRIGLQSTTDFYKRNAEIIQTNLAEAGIRGVVDEKTIADADYRTAQRMNGEYELWLSMTTVGMAAWGGVAHYAAAVTITSGQRFGTYADPEYLAAYDAMSKSTNYDEYIAAFSDIQRMNSEDVPVVVLAIMSTFFPYRNDAITGWIDYPAWGVINCKTWYNAVAR